MTAPGPLALGGPGARHGRTGCTRHPPRAARWSRCSPSRSARASCWRAGSGVCRARVSARTRWASTPAARARARLTGCTRPLRRDGGVAQLAHAGGDEDRQLVVPRIGGVERPAHGPGEAVDPRGGVAHGMPGEGGAGVHGGDAGLLPASQEGVVEVVGGGVEHLHLVGCEEGGGVAVRAVEQVGVGGQYDGGLGSPGPDAVQQLGEASRQGPVEHLAADGDPVPAVGEPGREGAAAHGVGETDVVAAHREGDHLGRGAEGRQLGQDLGDGGAGAGLQVCIGAQGAGHQPGERRGGTPQVVGAGEAGAGGERVPQRDEAGSGVRPDGGAAHGGDGAAEHRHAGCCRPPVHGALPGVEPPGARLLVGVVVGGGDDWPAPPWVAPTGRCSRGGGWSAAGPRGWSTRRSRRRP